MMGKAKKRMLIVVSLLALSLLLGYLTWYVFGKMKM